MIHSEAKFKALHGATVSRDEINEIIDLAKEENNSEVIFRLSKVLNDFPDDNRFELEIRQYPSTGLNGIQHKGDYKEALDDCGRLRKGFKFVSGKVVKVEPKTVSKNHNYTLFDGLKATAKNSDTILFNKQILLAKRNGYKMGQTFQLGKAKDELGKIVGNTKILLSGSVLKKAMTKDKDHSLKWENFINLPDYINNPLAIFKSDSVSNGLVILTEIKNELEKPVLIAFHLNEHLKINDIRSIYSKTNISIYKKWYRKGLLIYGNKKSELFRLFVAPIATQTKNPLSDNKNTKKIPTTKKTGLKSAVRKKLSPYTIAKNGTDLTDWKAGADEISDAIEFLRKQNKKIPNYYYVRLSKLMDKIEKAQGLKGGKASNELSDGEANKILQWLISKAVSFSFKTFSERQYIADFGQEGMITSPINDVQLDFEQLTKLFNRNRAKFYSLIKPTLEKPLLILPTKDKNNFDAVTFIKTFLDKKTGLIYFCSFTRNKDGYLEVVSNHPRRENEILNFIKKEYKNKFYQQEDSITSLRGVNIAKKSKPLLVFVDIGVPFSTTNIQKSIKKQDVRVKKSITTKKNGLKQPQTPISTNPKISNKGFVHVPKPKAVSENHNYTLFDGLKGNQPNFSTENFKNMKVSELRQFVLDYYNKNLKGNVIEIENHLSNVEFISNSGRKIMYPMYSEKAVIIEHLENIIKKSTYNNFGDRKKDDAPTVLGYLNFKSKFTIDGKKRHIRIAIRLDKDRSTKFKSFEIGKKESGNSRRTAVAHSKDGQEKPLLNNKNTKNIPNSKKNGLKQPQTLISTNPKISKIGVRSVANSEFYTVNGEIGKFLQRVEKKPAESVVITIDGEQGAGKTTMLYKFMDAFATTGNKSIFLSLEEHKDSDLAIEKTKYLSEKAKENLDAVSEISSADEFYKMIADYDVVFIDSWQKLLRMIGNIRLDEDLRKKFNGKVFCIIFQQTTTGRTKGGAEVVFDGDIIIKMHKGNSFSENYAYFDKNRYTKIPIENIRYNIATEKTYNPNESKQQDKEVQPTEKLSFSFNIN